jgi:hypothetical protein
MNTFCQKRNVKPALVLIAKAPQQPKDVEFSLVPGPENIDFLVVLVITSKIDSNIENEHPLPTAKC